MEQWVTPGRYQVPHLETTFDAATGTWTIGEVNTNPFNYPALSVDSQAYKNINTGVPTDFNQFEGCPVGHKMGPDGICRPITGYKGPGLPEVGLPVLPPDPVDPENPVSGFQENQYNRVFDNTQNDPYKDYMATIGTNKFYSTGNDYSALPGGLNNWTDEAFYDWGLDKGYITTLEVGGAQQTKPFGMIGAFGQMMNDKKFQSWRDSAVNRGILGETFVTSGKGGTGNRTVPSFELLKTRGEGEGFGGGGLLDITKNKDVTAENTWQSLVAEPVREIPMYDERTVNVGSDLNSKEILNTKPDEWWTNVYNKWLTGEYGYQDKDYGDNNFPDELNTVATDSDIMPALDFYGRLDPTQTNYFGELNTIYSPNGELAPAFRQFKQHILGNAESFDKETGVISTPQNQMFDPYLGKFVQTSPGLESEARRRARAEKLLAEQQEETNKIKPKPKPSFAIGTDIGNKAYNITTAQTGQYIGASVYKSPDKSSNVGGHYQQNGKFVQSNGTVTSVGSMSDSIYAMANGTAVNSVLDRTLKNNNSYKVMVSEAEKMKNAGKLTQAEYDKVKGYKTKNDYQKNNSNLTIHENGDITKGDEKPPPPKKGKGPGKGQQRTGEPRKESSGGNTGSSGKKDKIICTEMYRQTNLNDWKEAMKLWYLFQKKHLTPTHQVGYHFLFKPFVKGMKKSKILTAIGSHFAKQRTKDIKHIMFGTKFSLLGRTYRIMFEPICYVTGLLLTYKEKLAWQ